MSMSISDSKIKKSQLSMHQNHTNNNFTNNGVIINNPYYGGYGGYGGNSGGWPEIPDLCPSSPEHDSFSNPTTLIAANEKARIWGDPHIEGGDGDKYDFHEKGTYNLLEDKGVSLNARMDGKGKPTYTKEAGLNVNGNEVKIGADGKVMIGSGEQAKELQDGQTVQLGEGSYIKKEGDKIQAGTPEYQMEFNTNKNHDGEQHMDIDVKTRDGGVNLDGVMPTGLLGETFDAGKGKESAPKMDNSHYKRDGLFDNRQAPGRTPTPENPGPNNQNPFSGNCGPKPHSGSNHQQSPPPGSCGHNTNSEDLPMQRFRDWISGLLYGMKMNQAF